MKTVGIIPARMGSSRFPGKPLAKINGIPMIGHVYFRSRMCNLLDEVYVATCDKKISDYIKSIDGKVIMTSKLHKRASDRTAEALLKIEKLEGFRADIVVMIQGDEPMVFPKMIKQAVKTILADRKVQVVNLIAPLKTTKQHDDPNEIKVVVDNNNFALYFSREPIPTRKKKYPNMHMFKQVCIIPFRRDFLITFNKLAPTQLEAVESIDMLRIFDTYSVDTKKDLKFVEQRIKKDPLVSKYKDKIK